MQLLELLRHLASRIQELDRQGGLLDGTAELQDLLGGAHTTLLHLDAPLSVHDLADRWRIVDEARRASLTFDQPGDDQPWRRPQAE